MITKSVITAALWKDVVISVKSNYLADLSSESTLLNRLNLVCSIVLLDSVNSIAVYCSAESHLECSIEVGGPALPYTCTLSVFDVDSMGDLLFFPLCIIIVLNSERNR